MEKLDLSRRAFLAATTTTAVLAAAGCATQQAKTGGVTPGLPMNKAKVVPRRISPNQKLNIAAIGAGGKGWADINGSVMQGETAVENLVAMADPDWNNCQEAFATFPNAKQYRDYRKMLEEVKEIDAVTISTPDHTHAPAAYMAMKLGKHVYVQKPLTHTVAEARLLTQVANEMGVATQMGNQGRSGDGVRDLCEMIWSGAIGNVKEVHCWTNRPIWPQGIATPLPEEPVPPTLDWDLWIGSAPMRPYNKGYAPFNWRGWWDYGCGALGDMACHIMDPAFWSMRLGDVSNFTVELVQQEGNNKETFPTKSIVKYSFPARGSMPPVEVYWYDGDLRPPRPAGIPEDQTLGEGNNGSLFVGESGFITTGTYGDDSRLLPDEKMKDYVRPTQYIPRIPGEQHYRNWVQACKGGEPACSNFNVSGPFTEMVVFGNVAVALGKKMEWDSANFTIANDPSANYLLSKEYRKGWELPINEIGFKRPPAPKA